jgi:hypothetical protein
MLPEAVDLIPAAEHGAHRQQVALEGGLDPSQLGAVLGERRRP